MPRPNYAFTKRQRELAQKKKREEKEKRRAEKHTPPAEDNPSTEPAADNAEV
jgi:hypothetical protein